MSLYRNWYQVRPGAKHNEIRCQAVARRLSDPPNARSEHLSTSIFVVTKAVERACHMDSMMLIDRQFLYQKVGEDGAVFTLRRHGAFVFLYNPLSSIIRILESIKVDVDRYACLIKHLKVVGNSRLKIYLNSGNYTDEEKLYQLKVYLDLYEDVQKKSYSNVFRALIDELDSPIAEIGALISLLSTIWREGNMLNVPNPALLNPAPPNPAPSNPPPSNPAPPNPSAGAMSTDANAVGLENKGNGAMDFNIIDLEDRSNLTPTDPGTRAPTHGYAEPYWSGTSTLRPRLPSSPSPYRRTPSPNPFDYASQSPPPTPPATGFGYDPLPQFPRTPPPPPHPRTPSWKIYLSKRYPIDELYITNRDITIFGEARRLARIARKKMRGVQRMCIRLNNWYWRANESYAVFKTMYENADPELVARVCEHMELEKAAEERKKRQLETVVELDDDDDEEEEEEEAEEDMKMTGEDMEVEEELGLDEEEGEEEADVDMDDEAAQLALAVRQINAMEAREAGQSAATSRFDLDE